MKLPFFVVFLNIWADEPVFHKLERVTRHGDYTRCGRGISAGKPMMPSKHAVKFGRPCRGCFQVA